jgi:hypothetical protein
MAGGTDVSASRASSEAFPQNSNAPTYFVFGQGNNSFGATSQTASATPTSTAVAATGGSAGASGTGGNGAGNGGGGVALPAGMSMSEIGLILAAAVGAFLIARHI